MTTGDPPATRRAGALRSLVVAAATAALVACAPTPASPPEHVTVSVQQDRLDIARGRMTIDVHNDGAAPLRVTAIAYADPRWGAVVDWSGLLEVPAGRARSLGVELLPPVCGGAPSTAGGRAHLVFETDRGTASADYAVDDPFGFVPRAVQQGCFASRLAQTAEITLADVVAATRGGGSVAALTVRIANHGSRAVRLDTVKSTTLLQPAEGGWLWNPALTVDAGQTSAVELDAVPARCDMHAIAEDKVGTRFDATVSVLSDPVDSGTVTLVATGEQRARLYDVVASTCGFSG